MDRVAGWIEEAGEWCEGRSWLVRAPLLAWCAWLGARYLLDPTATTLFDGLNLGIHEAGHLVFAFGGQTICAAGGTLLQLAAPIASMVMFLRQPDLFAVSVCGAWLSTNLYGVATYVADARAQALPLVTVGGGEAMHDWTYLLSQFGLLQNDAGLAFLVRIVAFATMWSSIGVGAWMLWRMARSTKSARWA